VYPEGLEGSFAPGPAKTYQFSVLDGLGKKISEKIWAIIFFIYQGTKPSPFMSFRSSSISLRQHCFSLPFHCCPSAYIFRQILLVFPSGFRLPLFSDKEGHGEHAYAFVADIPLLLGQVDLGERENFSTLSMSS
jgi:hypothetical protein